LTLFINGKQESKTGPVWGLVPVWEGFKEKVKEAECSENIMNSCMIMEK
jgi:hypothetical protein